MVLANPTGNPSIILRNQRWRMEGEGGIVEWEGRSLEKELSFPGAYVLSEGYIFHTSNPARWVRKQEMKMMYIVAPAGPGAHVRALYKTKSLYQYSEEVLNARDSGCIANVRSE